MLTHSGNLEQLDRFRQQVAMLPLSLNLNRETIDNLKLLFDVAGARATLDNLLFTAQTYAKNNPSSKTWAIVFVQDVVSSDYDDGRAVAAINLAVAELLDKVTSRRSLNRVQQRQVNDRTAVVQAAINYALEMQRLLARAAPARWHWKM